MPKQDSEIRVRTGTQLDIDPGEEELLDSVPKSRQWLDSKGAAEFLLITVNALWHMTKKERVRVYRLGSRLRFRIEDLEELMK